MKLAAQRSRLVAALTLMMLSAILTACPAAGSSGNQQSGSSLVDTRQSQSGGSASATAPSRTAPSIPGGDEAEPATTPPSGAPANVRVSASEVTLENLTLTISVQTARRMIVGSAAPGAPTPQAQQGQGNQGQGGPAQQEMVLGSQTQQIGKNLDAAQGPPPDPKDGQGDYIRNVSIQVKDRSTGQVIPYLAVSMDILRDGRPVQYDQALVPAIPQGGNAGQMHYTNNVAFPGKGRYQLFVRIQPSPVLGNSAPPSIQFEVAIE